MYPLFISVSTYRFKKLFANEVYRDSGYNLDVVKGLLNYTCIFTTDICSI